MSSKQTVLVVDFPTVLSCHCLVGGLLLVLGTAGRTRGALTGFASNAFFCNFFAIFSQNQVPYFSRNVAFFEVF